MHCPTILPGTNPLHNRNIGDDPYRREWTGFSRQPSALSPLPFDPLSRSSTLSLMSSQKFVGELHITPRDAGGDAAKEHDLRLAPDDTSIMTADICLVSVKSPVANLRELPGIQS